VRHPIHFTQTIRLASRTGTAPAESDTWLPPKGSFAGIRRATCQTPEIAPGSAVTETTVTPPFAVMSGEFRAGPGFGEIPPVTCAGEVTPKPSRNGVTIEPAGAGFRQALTEPSGFNASGNVPLSDAELS